MRLIATKREAIKLRRKGERVVEVTRHNPLCLGIPPIGGLAPGACTCGGRGRGYARVLRQKGDPS